MNLIESLLNENRKFSKKKFFLLQEEKENKRDSSEETYYFTSDEIIKKFDLNKSVEVGLHCGTLEQAINRGKKYLHKIIIKSSYNPLRISEDISSSYSRIEFLRCLRQEGVVTDDEFKTLVLQIREVLDSSSESYAVSKIYQDFLINKGIDVIIYPNFVESSYVDWENPSNADKSLIILNGSIVKSIEVIQK